MQVKRHMKKTFGNGKKHLRQKNLLSWQNILNSRRIVTDKEEK